MRSAFRGILAAFAAVGGVAALGSPASAQGTGPSASLGGYGAASSYASAGMGGGGLMIIPYGGMFEGFMPSSMGGGTSLSYRARPSATMGSGRTSFSLSPLSGGMGQSRGRGRSAMSSPAGAAGGMRLGGGMGLRAPGPGGIGVMPPSLGYPFRQPPSLVPTSARGAGMSM